MHCINVQRHGRTALQPHLSLDVFAGCLLWDNVQNSDTDCTADGP